MLDDRREVIRCLITYTDWWQPATSSVMQVGGAKRDQNIGDGLNPGLLDSLEERVELCHRMTSLLERERQVLFFWYVKQLHIDDVADELGISRRQCFRLKKKAIGALITPDKDEKAA